MADLIISPEALADIVDVTEYLGRQAGKRTADSYDHDFRALFHRLEEFPESGPLRRRFGRNVRVGVVSPYVVLYDFDRSTNIVNILRIIDGRRRITSALLPDKDRPH